MEFLSRLKKNAVAHAANSVLLPSTGETAGITLFSMFFLCDIGCCRFWDNSSWINSSGSVSANQSLRINMEDFDGNQRYAEYENVKVASEQVMTLGENLEPELSTLDCSYAFISSSSSAGRLPPELRSLPRHSGRRSVRGLSGGRVGLGQPPGRQVQHLRQGQWQLQGELCWGRQGRLVVQQVRIWKAEWSLFCVLIKYIYHC